MINKQKYLDIVRQNILGILVAFGICAFLIEAFLKDSELEVTRLFIFLIFIFSYRERGQSWETAEKRLQRKGLTIEDAHNIKFVKNWEEIRRSGRYKYTLVDGGIITGMILVIPISLLIFPYNSNGKEMFKAFGDMMNFIGRCVIISYITGCIIYLIRWPQNERRFQKLTNPLNFL